MTGPREARRLDEHIAVGVAVLLGLSAVRAASRAFIQDDAFISFRYARNLVQHGQLVFNPGEYVEGYSNFLWTLLLAVALWARVDPIVAAKVLGGASWLGVIAVGVLYVRAILERTGDLRLRDLLVPVAALGLLPLNPSAAAYATGGLSTAFFAFGITLALYLCFARPDPDELPGPLAAVVLGGLLLVRPEAPLVLAFVALGLGVLHGRERLRGLLRWFAVPAAIGLAYAAWKLYYYGALLPNTFYAKSGHTPYFERGLLYVGTFVSSYPYVVLLFAPAAVLAWRARRGGAQDVHGAVVAGLPAGLVAAFAAYVAWVGGDFMEYKPLMHVYPVLVVTFAAGIAWLRRSGDWVGRGAQGLALLALGSGAWFQEPRYPPMVFSPRVLQDQLYDALQWAHIGFRLGRVLPPDTVISVGPAGAIPYYSGLRTVDHFGLTEPEIAHQDVAVRSVPGHEKAADSAFLVERGVNVQILPRMYRFRPDQLPPADPDGEWLYIRVRPDQFLQARYLVQTPALTRWLADHPQDFHRSDREK
ncbi:MAG: hypothetical protein H6737_23235 [Alphaproteobacteria bacterium]|nr:hypothetical protein [Alphaproteobacteria bacterium]